MNKITEQIWIGNAADAAHATPLSRVGINAILNVAVDLSDKRGWDNGILLAHCGLIDGPGNPLAAYYSALFQLAGLIAQGKTVLVHCVAGQSRSVSTVICYLHAKDPQGWDHWRSYIRARRSTDERTPVQAHREAFDQLDWDFIRSVLS